MQRYSDVDIACGLDTRKTTNGYMFSISGEAISWCSKLQQIVAPSTSEVAYISATKASKEAIWLGRFAKELGVPANTPVLAVTARVLFI